MPTPAAQEGEAATSPDERRPPLLGDPRSGPEATAGPARREPGSALLERELDFAGLAPGDVGALVIVGEPGLQLLEAAFTRLPDLQAVLIFASEAGSLDRLLAEVAHTGWGAIDPGRCFFTRPIEPDAGDLVFPIYLELFRFFSACGVSPGRALVLSDLDPEPAPAVAQAALAASRDFCTGFSSAFFAALARDPTTSEIPSALLSATADRLYQQGERYHALKFYLHAYRRTPRPEFAWRILECWSDLRCFDQVLRWLQEPAFPEAFRQQLAPQIAAARAEQAAARARTLAANLTAIARHFPDGTPPISAEPPGDLTIVELPPLPWLLTYESGRKWVKRAPYFLLVRIGDAGPRELNPPTDPRTIHQNMSPPDGRDPYHACVAGWVASWSAAYVLLWTDVASAIPGWHRVINLIEPDTRALGLLLQTEDLSDRLQPDRVYLFLGEHAERDFLRHLEEQPNHVIPGIRAGVGPSLEAGFARVQIARDQRLEDNFRQLAERYPPAHPARILDVLTGQDPRPLRWLFITSRYTSVVQYLASDFAESVRELGHESLVVREPRSGQELSPVHVTAELLRFAPDLVVLTNHTRPQYGRLLPPGLPVVTWIQDEMPKLADPALIRALGPFDLTYGYSTTVQARYRGLGYPFIGHLPFAVRPTLSPVPATCRPEVVYATHLDAVSEPAAYPGLADWLARRMSAEERIPIGTPKIAPLLAEGCAALGYLIPPGKFDPLLFWAAMFARRLDRIQVADRILAAGLPLACYGRGWEKLPRFAPHARGIVTPGEPLRRVLREHKVILHINGECNLHPRVLEGFCAGGFVLGRHEDSDDLPGETADQLALGRELILFHNDEEMVTLIRRALLDEDWRRAVIEAAQARIRTSHTFVNRAQVVLTDLKNQLRR